jgi:CheY-like chemotaxis protein
MLDQVMMNLAVNARDAMPHGGTFTIETGHRVITEDDSRSVLDASPGLHVVLRVTDTGCGITVEQMPHIFEPFFTTKEPGRGTGLGLATVFGIVKQHRGWITVSSTVGHGTTFEVLLPATTDPVITPHDVGAEPSVLGGTETILLVEDEPVLRRVIRTLLTRKGYRVLEACNGLDALAIWEISASEIDLLLTDLVMPEGLDGRDLANELQACKPELKVILTSGYSTDGELQVGQCYLAKPCKPRQLLETVRACFEVPAER